MDFDALVLNIIDLVMDKRKYISKIDRFPEDVRSCALKFMEFGVPCYYENPKLQSVLEPYLTTIKVFTLLGIKNLTFLILLLIGFIKEYIKVTN